MNILLEKGNGFGAMIALRQIEAKVKERDAVGLELVRREGIVRRSSAAVKVTGNDSTRVVCLRKVVFAVAFVHGRKRVTDFPEPARP
jgi:hypothetical protein